MILSLVDQFRETNKDTPIVLMGYLNTFISHIDMVQATGKDGIDSILVVDIPGELNLESYGISNPNINTISLISPTTKENRVELIANNSTGFIYYVNLRGVTGSSNLDIVIEVLHDAWDPMVSGAEMVTKPDISYDAVAGLDEQVETVREAIELPLTSPELFRKVGITPPKGILLVGPPGCGKTLLAKAVANQTDATFIRMVGSELAQKYIGEGGRMVREL